mmetsp:Transcript_43294/g.71945  ORF Transcript_43294/g.71945 Transcript_43294/m.71945 type:complete len:1230 (-) Transcript_43294:96-3785(-)
MASYQPVPETKQDNNEAIQLGVSYHGRPIPATASSVAAASAPPAQHHVVVSAQPVVTSSTNSLSLRYPEIVHSNNVRQNQNNNDNNIYGVPVNQHPQSSYNGQQQQQQQQQGEHRSEGSPHNQPRRTLRPRQRRKSNLREDPEEGGKGKKDIQSASSEAGGDGKGEEGGTHDDNEQNVNNSSPPPMTRTTSEGEGKSEAEPRNAHLYHPAIQETPPPMKKSFSEGDGHLRGGENNVSCSIEKSANTGAAATTSGDNQKADTSKAPLNETEDASVVEAPGERRRKRSVSGESTSSDSSHTIANDEKETEENDGTKVEVSAKKREVTTPPRQKTKKKKKNKKKKKEEESENKPKVTKARLIAALVRRDDAAKLISFQAKFRFKINSLQDECGRTVMHWAGANNCPNVLLAAIKRFGGDVNCVDSNVGSGHACTPLHYATAGGYLKCIQILTTFKADINVRDTNGATPLHWACQRGRLHIVKFLLDKDAQGDIVDNFGATPLLCSFAKGHIEVLNHLIASCFDGGYKRYRVVRLVKELNPQREGTNSSTKSPRMLLSKSPRKTHKSSVKATQRQANRIGSKIYDWNSSSSGKHRASRTPPAFHLRKIQGDLIVSSSYLIFKEEADNVGYSCAVLLQDVVGIHFDEMSGLLCRIICQKGNTFIFGANDVKAIASSIFLGTGAYQSYWKTHEEEMQRRHEEVEVEAKKKKQQQGKGAAKSDDDDDATEARSFSSEGGVGEESARQNSAMSVSVHDQLSYLLGESGEDKDGIDGDDLDDDGILKEDILNDESAEIDDDLENVDEDDFGLSLEDMSLLRSLDNIQQESGEGGAQNDGDSGEGSSKPIGSGKEDAKEAKAKKENEEGKDKQDNDADSVTSFELDLDPLGDGSGDAGEDPSGGGRKAGENESLALAGNQNEIRDEKEGSADAAGVGKSDSSSSSSSRRPGSELSSPVSSKRSNSESSPNEEEEEEEEEGKKRSMRFKARPLSKSTSHASILDDTKKDAKLQKKGKKKSMSMTDVSVLLSSDSSIGFLPPIPEKTTLNNIDKEKNQGDAKKFAKYLKKHDQNSGLSEKEANEDSKGKAADDKKDATRDDRSESIKKLAQMFNENSDGSEIKLEEDWQVGVMMKQTRSSFVSRWQPRDFWVNRAGVLRWGKESDKHTKWRQAPVEEVVAEKDMKKNPMLEFTLKFAHKHKDMTLRAESLPDFKRAVAYLEKLKEELDRQKTKLDLSSTAN